MVFSKRLGQVQPGRGRECPGRAIAPRGHIVSWKQFPRRRASRARGGGVLPRTALRRSCPDLFFSLLKGQVDVRAVLGENGCGSWGKHRGRGRKPTPSWHNFTPRIRGSQGGLLGSQSTRASAPRSPPWGDGGHREEEGARERSRKVWGEAGGREKPGRKALGEPPQQGRQRGLSASRVSKGRAGCTYPAWVVPAAGAGVPGVPGVSHGADCAAAAPRAARPRPGRPGSHHPAGDAPRSRRRPPRLGCGLGPLPAPHPPLYPTCPGRASLTAP